MLKINKTIAETSKDIRDVGYKIGQLIQMVTVLIVATVVLAGLTLLRLAK
jgi:hypothetical protein